jgi:uncharacterized protein (DUF697 family)
MAAATSTEAAIQARATVNKWAIGFASLAWIPGSHYVMWAGDVMMVMQIGSVFGVDLDRTNAARVFATIAAPWIGSKIAHTLLDFIPILGWAAKSLVAFLVTKAMGETLILYYKDCSPLPA